MDHHRTRRRADDPADGLFRPPRDPVTTDLGPVLTLEDVIGGKICALAGRAYERDYLDTAAALELYSPAELMASPASWTRAWTAGTSPRQDSDWTRSPTPRSPSSSSPATTWLSCANDSRLGPATPRPQTPEPLTTPAPLGGAAGLVIRRRQ